MGPINVAELAEDALLLMDSAPIIYFLEANPKFSPIFKPGLLPTMPDVFSSQ